MDQVSAKHGPRMDDTLKEEAAPLLGGSPSEPRAQESRAKEPPGEDQPVPGEILGDERSWEGQELTAAGVAARSELARHLEPSAFPASVEELVEAARRQHAPDGIVATLRLPSGRTFQDLQEVWRALGGPDERPV